MRITKEDKLIQKKISKDIETIRSEYYKNESKIIVEEIRRYYNNNHYSENDLFYRIDKLETFSMFEETYFSLVIGVLFAYIFDNINLFIEFTLSKLISYSIILIVVFINVVKLVRDKSSPKNGKEKYLDKKEIEIIINVIEGNNAKMRSRRFRRIH